MKKAIYTNDGMIVDVVNSFTIDQGDIIANNIRYANCMSIDCSDDVQAGSYKVVNGVVIHAPILPRLIVPTEIRMAQCRAQLIIDGKDDDVELLLASIQDPIKQKLYRAYLEYEPIAKRDNVMINEMAPALGIDLDNFFIEASKL